MTSDESKDFEKNIAKKKTQAKKSPNLNHLRVNSKTHQLTRIENWRY